MRSVRTLAVAALLLLPAYHVASAGEPKQDGILKVLAGHTDLKHVHAVCAR